MFEWSLVTILQLPRIEVLVASIATAAFVTALVEFWALLYTMYV